MVLVGEGRCPTKIGQFHLPLDTLGRYVMTHWNKAPNTDVVGWEIGLTDGSVFHGKLSGGEGKVTLKVSDQSAFTVPLNAIRYVRNRRGSTGCRFGNLSKPW